jgi:APA family basic amino acid/polyamine antiporter
VGIFILRKREPNAVRPYSVWGHPIITLAFILFSAFYLIVTLYNDITNYINDQQPIINSVFGLLITLIGVPIYLLRRR